MKIKIPVPKMIELSKLKAYPYNVKLHPKQQIEGLMELIKMIGFKDPIVIDDDNTILAGHGRLEAAKQLGMLEVPYVKASDLSEDEKKAFIIMDNKINESAWNKENLRFLLQDIKFDFSPFKMNFSSYMPVTQEIYQEREIEPQAQIGDIYQLGRHRIMCGNSSKKSNIDALLEGTKVDQLLTDPPYGIDYSNKNDFLNNMDKGNSIQTPIENDAIDDYRTFFANFLSIIPFAEYNTAYIFMSGLELHNLRLALDDVGMKWGAYLVWLKNNHVLGRSDYNGKHEFIVYGWKDKHKFYGDFSTTVLEFDKPLASDLHPTMKPVELLVRLLRDGSQEAFNVYDPFLGSGSTLIACEQTGRNCYGIEIDPHYVDVTIQRWENFTNQKAVKLDSMPVKVATQ